MRRPRAFYGWYILGMAMLGALLSAGTSQVFFSIMLKPITDEFGWGRTALTGIITLGTVGNGVWIEVTAATARESADAAGATGYYRPEDLHLDPDYTGEGVRFCVANTGNEGAANYAEVVCGIDVSPLEVANGDGPMLTTTVNRFWEGDTDANSFDNLAFQPGTGSGNR